MFETILELGSTLPCSTASPVVLHDFGMVWFQTTRYCCAKLNDNSDKFGKPVSCAFVISLVRNRLFYKNDVKAQCIKLDV